MIPDLSISDFKLAKSVCLANLNVSTPVASYAPPPPPSKNSVGLGKYLLIYTLSFLSF